MTNLPDKIISLNHALKELEKNSNFLACQSVINQVVSLLEISSDGPWKLFVDSNGKIRSNASWFMMAEGFADKRASYKIAEENDKNIDLKVYWIQKVSKSIIGWLVALTPNFEDEPFYKSKNIGIDFVIPEKADRVIVILSHNYIIRTLELKGELFITQQEIFAKWLQAFDFANKEQVHNILWESFDLEPLNKKFYKEVSSFFVELKQYLSDKKIFNERHSALFTNRLIGRIIFCWFLEKKDIINEDFGYFNIQDQKSTEYYKEKLEALFFKVFNTPISEREKGIDNKTPFLNGGLFEPREHDKFGDSTLTFPTDYFDRFFAFLKHYNFTTDESTSSFQQVAIDPEMLGRIFENLLAEQTEETGEQARKAKGAFYTPREIVDYMCKESLREYLKTQIKEATDRDEQINKLLDSKVHEWRDQQRNFRDRIKFYKSDILKALDDLKILDPACGSGAFPMGMMQLLLTTYERLEPRFNPYTTKLDIIKNNIYGVDIEPMAVEISRLRAWLSIVVDEESDSKKIEPLPNLDFKFVCANSLIPLDGGKIQTLDGDDKLEEEMLNIRDSYFKAWSTNGKKKLKDKFGKLILQKNQGVLFGKSVRREQIETYHPFDSENVIEFFDTDFMFGVSGFDVVIGNPPYIKEYTSKNAFDGLRDSPYYMGKMDLWYFFACYGLDLLKKHGVQAFIAPNNWISNFGAKLMREKLLDEAIIHQFIDFGNYKVFDTAGIQTMVYILEKNNQNEDYKLEFARLKIEKPTSEELIHFLKTNFDENNDNFEKFLFDFKKKFFSGGNIQFLSSEIDIVIHKIQTGENIFLTNKEVAQGIVLPQDFLNKKNQEKLGGDFKIGDGIFVLSKKEKDSLNLFDNENEIMKPYFMTPNFYKYAANLNNIYWIIYTDSRFKNKNEIKKYPNLKKHLDKYREIITSDNKPYGLHRARDEKFFQGEKIVVARKCTEPSFSYSNFDCYVSATFYVIKTERVDIKYLTTILNSKVVKFWLKNKGKMQGNNFQLDKEPLVNIPIKKISTEDQKPFISLVDQILEITSAPDYDPKNPPVRQKELEKKIDEMVYRLYGLTEEDIKIVEDSFKK